MLSCLGRQAWLLLLIMPCPGMRGCCDARACCSMYSKSTTWPGSAAEKSRLRVKALGGLHRRRRTSSGSAGCGRQCERQGGGGHLQQSPDQQRRSSSSSCLGHGTLTHEPHLSSAGLSFEGTAAMTAVRSSSMSWKATDSLTCGRRRRAANGEFVLHGLATCGCQAWHGDHSIPLPCPATPDQSLCSAVPSDERACLQHADRRSQTSVFTTPSPCAPALAGWPAHLLLPLLDCARGVQGLVQRQRQRRAPGE